MKPSNRIGIWLASLLLSVTAFSLFFGSGMYFIFRMTLMFALPAWLLYLPFVIALKDAEGRHIWSILISGTLIGPASLALWGILLQLSGEDIHTIWQGDGIGLGVAQCMAFATIVGLLITALYVIGLKILHRQALHAES